MFGNAEVAVVGDPTNVGGRILEGAAMLDIDGAPVAIQGSAVMCGACGLTKIAKGSSHVDVMGMPIALHGDPLLCGHTINVRGRKRVSSSACSESSPRPPGSFRNESPAAAGTEALVEMASGFDRRIQVNYANGAPYAGAAYVIAVQGQAPIEGSLAGDGTSSPIKSTKPGHVVYGVVAPQAEAI
ncbi:PAAR domain-containing protein [Luteibacter rhizovicinus]|nr:PAAR domain-containing protein [Luteibacter rhizovicinus]